MKVRSMRSSEFNEKFGRRCNRGDITVKFRRTHSGEGLAAVGWVTPKKIGNAVARNRCRRRARTVISSMAADGVLAEGFYVVSFRVAYTNFDELEGDLRAAITAAARRS